MQVLFIDESVGQKVSVLSGVLVNERESDVLDKIFEEVILQYDFSQI
ncbi:hypothetical protein [Acidianus sp. RZ1]|nr:hypothetical protein [Acidianus sp. RZ1]NON61299.1 hypothetical protein [Acidianus sp. RZ1]